MSKKNWLVEFEGNKYKITVSKRKNKKYDVYNMNDDYLFSFGDRRYEHYKDRLGYFKNLDHNNKERRDNYLARSENLNEYGLNANTFARELLW